MSVLGIDLAVSPTTSTFNTNPGLVKGAAWLFREIVSRL